MSDDPAWFAPKRYGFGAVPVTWQGWALTLGFVALLVAASRLLHYCWIAFASVAAILIVTFIVITARTTRGGLRWRWGEDE
jgi:hypothetical protein